MARFRKPKTSDQTSNFVGTLVLYKMKFGVWFHLPLRPGLRTRSEAQCGGIVDLWRVKLAAIVMGVPP